MGLCRPRGSPNPRTMANQSCVNSFCKLFSLMKNTRLCKNAVCHETEALSYCIIHLLVKLTLRFFFSIGANCKVYQSHRLLSCFFGFPAFGSDYWYLEQYCRVLMPVLPMQISILNAMHTI